MQINLARVRRRTWTNRIALLLSSIATVIGLFFLFWILYTTLTRGMEAMSWNLLTQMTPPAGSTEGGIANALVGSALMCGAAIAVGAPFGIAAGIYLAEYAKLKKTGAVIRFVNDILLSAPSIVLGLFAFSLVSFFGGGFSGWAGALALSLIVLPVVVRTTDEMLRLQPKQLREAALSLGIPYWKVNAQVLLRAALPGVTTGVLLALARISGETAPLLFTALGNSFWSTDMSEAMESVPTSIAKFAMNPDEFWNKLAWASAFLMTSFVLLISLTARAVLKTNKATHD
jgi:phosphate transport system permease protein